MSNSINSSNFFEDVNTRQGVTLVCRFGNQYFACKPQNRPESVSLGFPMMEFWAGPSIGEQFLENLHPWKNSTGIIEQLFTYLIDDKSFQANATYEQMIKFIASGLHDRQLHMFLLEDKRPLFTYDYSTSTRTPLPFITEIGKKIPEENWVDLEYQYADGTGIGGAAYEVYNRASGGLITSGILGDAGTARVTIPDDVDAVDVIYKSDPTDVAEIIVQDEPHIVEAPPGNWYEKIGSSFKSGAEWTWGTIKGDFNEEQIITNAAITAIPVVDQAGDIRDIVACIKFLVWDKRYNETAMWLTLVLTTIGLIPSVGSVLKGVLILVCKKSKLSELLEVFNYFNKGNGVKWLEDLYAGQLMKYMDEAAKIATNIFDELSTALMSTKQYIPAYCTDIHKKFNETIDTMHTVKSGINDNFSKVGEDIKIKLGDSLNIKIPPVSTSAKGKALKKQGNEKPPALEYVEKAKIKAADRRTPDHYNDDERYTTLNHQKGAAGEYNADQYMKEQGHTPLGKTGEDYVAGANGIDGVYKGANPPPDYIISEAKYNRSGLKNKTADGRQMSDDWVSVERLEAAGIPESDIEKIRDGIESNNGTVQKVVVRNQTDGQIKMEELNKDGYIKKSDEFENERIKYNSSNDTEIGEGEWYVKRYNEKQNLF